MCVAFRNMEVIGDFSQIYFHGVTMPTSGLEWIGVWLAERGSQSCGNKVYRQLFEAVWLRRKWKCQDCSRNGIKEAFKENRGKPGGCVKFTIKCPLGTSGLNIVERRDTLERTLAEKEEGLGHNAQVERASPSNSMSAGLCLVLGRWGSSPLKPPPIIFFFKGEYVLLYVERMRKRRCWKFEDIGEGLISCKSESGLTREK